MTTGESARAFVIGVTGKIACGKSSVLKLLSEKGVETIDADMVYHELIRPGLPLWQKLRSVFGEGIVNADGQIDRKALGAIVFSEQAALRLLDELTHPAVIDEIKRRIDTSSARIIAVDGVKLVESGMDRLCDVVWRVTCSRETQIERLKARNGLSETEAAGRINTQPSPPASTQPEIAIQNDAGFAVLQDQVDRAWNSLPVTQPRQIL